MAKPKKGFSSELGQMPSTRDGAAQGERKSYTSFLFSFFFLL